MRKIIIIAFFIPIVTLLSSCVKRPEACIIAADKNYAVQKVSLTSCSQNSAYDLWVFEDETGIEGEDGSRWFHLGGVQTIKLMSYSKNGRKTDETSTIISAGFKYLDSLVITQLSSDLFFLPGTSTPVNMRVIIDDIKSENVYNSVSYNDLPLTFYFKSGARIENRETYYKVCHYDYVNNFNQGLTTYNSLNPHNDFDVPWEYNYTELTSKKIKSKLYWNYDY